MRFSVPITITKAGAAVTPITLDVDGNRLAGYKTESNTLAYIVRQGGDDVYIGCGDDGIYFNVFGNEHDAYTVILGVNSLIPTRGIDMPYDIEQCGFNVQVSGIDPTTSKLICDISLVTGSSDGEFVARNVLIEEDVDTLIPLSNFVIDS